MDDIFHEFCKTVDEKDKSVEQLENIITESKSKAGFKNHMISAAEFSKLYRKEVTSRIINTLINDIGIVELSNEEKKKKGTERKHEIGFVTYGQLASGLKKRHMNVLLIMMRCMHTSKRENICLKNYTISIVRIRIIYLPNIELTILCNNMKLYILKKKVIQV